MKYHDMFTSLLKLKAVRLLVISSLWPSPIPSGDLEIPLRLTFTCGDKLTLYLMNEFVKNLYIIGTILDWFKITMLKVMMKKRMIRMLALL